MIHVESDAFVFTPSPASSSSLTRTTPSDVEITMDFPSASSSTSSEMIEDPRDSSSSSPFSEFIPSISSAKVDLDQQDLDYESLRLLQIQRNNDLLYQLGLFKPPVVKVVKPRVEKVRGEKSWFSPRVSTSGGLGSGSRSGGGSGSVYGTKNGGNRREQLSHPKPSSTPQVFRRETRNSRGLLHKLQTNRIQGMKFNKAMKLQQGGKFLKKPIEKKNETKSKTPLSTPRAPSTKTSSTASTSPPLHRRPQYSQYPPKHLLHTLHPRQVLPPSPSPTASCASETISSMVYIATTTTTATSAASSPSTSPTRPTRTSSQVSYSIFYRGTGKVTDLFDYMRAKNTVVDVDTSQDSQNGMTASQEVNVVEKKVEKRKAENVDGKRKMRKVEVVVLDEHSDEEEEEKKKDASVEGLKFWIDIPRPKNEGRRRTEMVWMPIPVYAKDLPERKDSEKVPVLKTEKEVETVKTASVKKAIATKKSPQTTPSVIPTTTSHATIETKPTNRIRKLLCDRIAPASLRDTLANCTSVRVGSRYGDCE